MYVYLHLALCKNMPGSQYWAPHIWATNWKRGNMSGASRIGRERHLIRWGLTSNDCGKSRFCLGKHGTHTSSWLGHGFNVANYVKFPEGKWNRRVSILKWSKNVGWLGDSIPTLGHLHQLTPKPETTFSAGYSPGNGLVDCWVYLILNPSWICLFPAFVVPQDVQYSIALFDMCSSWPVFSTHQPQLIVFFVVLSREWEWEILGMGWILKVVDPSNNDLLVKIGLGLCLANHLSSLICCI